MRSFSALPETKRRAANKITINRGTQCERQDLGKEAFLFRAKKEKAQLAILNVMLKRRVGRREI